MTLLGLKTGNNAILSHASYFTDITSPLIWICSIGIFLTFKKMNAGYNKTINMIANLTFPVYLIHDNPFFRELFWNDIVKAHNFYTANIAFLVLHMMLVVVGLFALAAIIEFIRCRIEARLFRLEILNMITNKINAIYNV